MLKEDIHVPPEHYYGDRVRFCYVIGSLIMLTTLPFFITRLPIPLLGAIVLIIVINFFAGITNPKQLWVALFDLVTSLIALSIFEYFAVITYLSHGSTDSFFWINETLSVVFFFALYYAVKTTRGFFVERSVH